MPRFSADALQPIGELNVDLGFKGNVKQSIGLNGVNYFNYSNPLTTTMIILLMITLQERISIFSKNGILIERKKQLS
jgi:hypothetical protein